MTYGDMLVYKIMSKTKSHVSQNKNKNDATFYSKMSKILLLISTLFLPLHTYSIRPSRCITGKYGVS